VVDDKQLERVRKLLAQAVDPAATAEEAEAFNVKAAELLARYGIDDALVAASGNGPGEQIEAREIAIERPYGVPKGNLLHAVAKFNNAEVVLTTVGKGPWATVHHATLVGYSSDLDRVVFLYTRLLMQAVPLMLSKPPVEIGSDGRPRKVNTSAYRYDQLEGFRVAVQERLETARDRTVQEVQAQDAGQSVALVLRSRAQDVEAFVAKTLSEAQPGARRTPGENGFARGYQAGRNADLQHTRVDGPKQVDGA
jgi:hypothetical protein